MKRDVEQRRRAEASRKGVEVKRQGLALGFDAVGIATLEANAHAAELDRWLAAGYAGTMTYLHRQAEKRKDPARIMPGAKVAIVTLTNYFHGSDHPGLAPGVSPAPRKVAQYAWSSDYHQVLGRRLELDRWLAAGYAGTMTYLHRQAEKRKDPARIMPGAKVAIVTLTNYFHGSDHPGLAPGVSPAPRKVAQYAWSSDYHQVLGRRLE